jgi:HEAT repeat protein
MCLSSNARNAGTYRRLAPVALSLSTIIAGLLTTSAVSASPRARRQDQLVPGERRGYRLSYTNASESDFRALFASRAGSAPTSGSASGLNHAFRTRAEGEWVATVLDSRDAQVRIAYHLRQPTVRLWTDGQEALTLSNTVREGLKRDLVVVADRRGRVRSVQFDTATGELSRNYARTLLGLTQWVLPGEPTAETDQWTAEEEDPNGTYLAHYQGERSGRGDGSAVQTIRKTKVRYLVPRHRLQAVNQEVRPTVLPAGILVARFNRQSAALLSLSGSETESMVIRGATVGHSVTSLRLQYVGREKVGTTELSALREADARQARRTAAQSLSAAASREASEAALERKELGDASLESLLAEMAKAEAAAARRTGPAPLYTPLYLKLKALINLHPECCQRLGTLLAGSNPNGVTAPLLTGALSAVGHPLAQAALVEALRSGSPDTAALTREIASLASVENPTPSAEATMRWEAVHAPTRSLRVMAELALGTMARNLADSAPARAGRIVDEIVRKLRAAPSNEEARLGLMALGNTGTARALPVIARFIAHSSPPLRASAVAALRWIDAPPVNAWLVHCLMSDPDATVRQEAAAALGFREPTAQTIAAQQRAFRAEPAESVRLAILSNLGRARRAFPELNEFIRKAAAGDASPHIRRSESTLP